MKKIYHIIIIGLSFILFLSTSYAKYNVSKNVKSRIDTVMTVVEKQRGTMSTIAQINKYQKIINTFSKVKLSGEGGEMIGYLSYLFKNKVSELKKQIVTQEQLIANVDRDKVQRAWVSWHNTERAKLGLKPYKINDELNFSALTWAQHLAKLNNTTDRINHKRKSTDGYYNYSSILDWFKGLGINFDYKGTAFTENIAYQYYNCKKADCTQDMINALKKGYNFFLKEKSYNGAHYRAIVHPYFDEIGVGVALIGKRYWVVSHYGIGVE